jgi:spoIIIJ-associated protein
VEWVETTSRSVQDALDQALDQLGVDEQEAEWEVLEEPKQGLFGRTRGQARLRARVRPKAQPAKQDRRDRRRGRGKSEGERKDRPSYTAEESTPTVSVEDLEADGAAVVAHAGSSDQDKQAADGRNRRRRQRAGGDDQSGKTKERTMPEQTADASAEEVGAQVREFLDGLVTAFGESADVIVDQSEDEVVGRVDAKLGLLIGPKGLTLDAIQELTRVTAQRSTPSEIRIKVDVGDYRAQRQEALERFARQVAERVREGGKSIALEPMPSVDRKIVHDALADESGVATHSDGAEPRRRVIVAPVDAD